MKQFTYRKVGGIHFIKVFRINLAFSVSRKKAARVVKVQEPVRVAIERKKMLLSY